VAFSPLCATKKEKETNNNAVGRDRARRAIVAHIYRVVCLNRFISDIYIYIFFLMIL